VIADLDFVLPREREAAGDVDGGRCIWVVEVVLDQLQVWENKGHEEESHVMGKQIGEKRRTGAYWQGRNRPEIPVGGTESGDEFRRLETKSAEERKGGEGGVLGVL
jgi:hypothetical protein